VPRVQGLPWGIDTFHFLTLRNQFYEESRTASYQEKKQLKKMETTRNAIAHEGASSSRGKFHAENLPYTYKSCSSTLKKLISASPANNKSS
jgi:hypothetical protein